jgi:protein-L-isoaspartate(D-aspartate) O-methyltransferase
MAERHRQQLVAGLRELGCIRTQNVADAFASVARERFVPPTTPLDRVYSTDEAIPTRLDGVGVSISSSSAPRIMAVMLEMLGAELGQLVLEIGAGTGYNAALLSRLVGPTGSVISIDIDSEVVVEAVEHLKDADITGVTVIGGDGWFGHRGRTFDRIIVTAECWDIAPAWVEQLSQGGTLVLPLWLRPGLTLALAFEKTRDRLTSRSAAYCGFMPLRGPHASPPLRALVHSVPWDDRSEAAEQRWLAYFDDATEDRTAAVLDLLKEPISVRLPSSPFAGWNVRLALQESGPICFTRMHPPLGSALGLLDRDLSSLAVLYGDSVYSYGQPDCGDRLVAFLSTPEPIDLADLAMEATPHGTVPSQTGSVCISRPCCDLWISENSRTP